MTLKIGQIGTNHVHALGKAQALSQTADVEFVGVHEPDPVHRRAAASNPAWEGLAFLDIPEALLDDPTVDVVFVETHPLQNQYWVRRALLAGKHVHGDKAPGTSLADFRELIALARESNLVLQQGYQFRYNSGLGFAVQAAKNGLLGRITHVRGRISVDLADYEGLRPEIEPCPGGMFYYLGSHLTDLVVAILGRPVKITPFLRSDGDSTTPFIDNTVVVYEFPRATAVIEASALEVNAFEHRRFEVFGTKGSVIVEPYENPAPQVLLALDEARNGYKAGWQPIEVGNQARYVGDIADLIDLIGGRREPIVSSEHDITVHETLLRGAGLLGG